MYPFRVISLHFILRILEQVLHSLQKYYTNVHFNFNYFIKMIIEKVKFIIILR